MKESQPSLRIATVLAIALALGSLAYLGKGLVVAWSGGDSDLRIREREWSDFSKGIYPNLRYTPEGKKPASAHSVYPAYALPMFAIFFAPGDFVWARIILQVMSLAGLAAMMMLGWKALRCHGWQAGCLGMAMAPAISGNCTAIALGQFSILSSGLLAAQILAIQANRPWVAGFFWSFAMIKPQIALPFALLFLIRRQWSGFIIGSAILGGLTLFALEWTGWSLSEYLIYSIGTESLSFAKQGQPALLEALPVSPRMLTVFGLAIVCLAGLWILVMRDGLPPERLLALAGLASALGWVLFYHRQYDNQMVFPLMLAITAVALRKKTALPIALASLLALSLYLPAGMVARSEAFSVLAFLAPLVVAFFLLLSKHPPDKPNRVA